MFEFKFPFEPPMEDLKMTVKVNGGTAYIFDTFCKNRTEEEHKQLIKEMWDILAVDARKKALRKLESKT